MKKELKIKWLKKEIKDFDESIKMSKTSITQETNLLKEKKSKSARDWIKNNIEENKNAIKQFLKEKKIVESILKDYKK